MTYAELKTATKNNPLPATYVNSEGENVIISHVTEKWSYGDEKWERNFFQLATAQHNGWVRYNCIFDDGSAVEFYSK